MNHPKSLLSDLCLTLNIDIETYQENGLLNNFVEPGKKIKNLSWGSIKTFDNVNEEIIDVKKEELEKIIYPYNEIIIMSNGNQETFNQKDGFNSYDLLDCILNVEIISRQNTNWFGGIDAHHIFFEGLHLLRDNKYYVSWGS